MMQREKGREGKKRKGKKNKGIYDRNIGPPFVVIFFLFLHPHFGVHKGPIKVQIPRE
jgi:hypothetical protein